LGERLQPQTATALFYLWGQLFFTSKSFAEQKLF